MKAMVATLAQARNAKSQARRTFSRYGEVVGVGVAKLADGYCVKVNLRYPPDAAKKMPGTVAGVPIQVEVVGAIRKRAVAKAGK